jgi:hypothetical protein
MVDDEPAFAILDVSEAVARGPRLGFSVFDIRKRVIAGIHRRIAVHAYTLLAERNLKARKNLKRIYEILPQRWPFGV